MELKMLTQKSVRDILSDSTKKIYLVDFSETYLEELLGKYDIKERISGILSDTEDRMSGSLKKGSRSVCFQGREISVYPYRYFCELGGDACFIILNDYFRETYEKLVQFGKSAVNRHENIYFFANHETEIDLSYRERYRDCPLENIILFRSGPHASSYVKGMDYTDNARALFEYMLREGYNERYELVWLVKNPSDYIHITEQYEQVHFLSFDWSVSENQEERDAYYRALCLSKYLFMTDAYGFCRNAREDQIRVQLWHGCGFKTRINFVRCEHRYEYKIVISEVYKKLHEKIFGLREDQVLVTGYPKDDWLYHTDRLWREKLGIPEAGHSIFWLPTFRKPVGKLSELTEKAPEGQTGLPMLQSVEELHKLNVFLKEKDAVMVIKLHPFQDEKSIYREGMTNIVLLTNEMLVEKGLQINQILGAADGLISDYSSAAIDYLLMDRPVGFTLDDVEEYEKSRGFVFEPVREWLPGSEIYSYEDFVKFAGEVIDGKDSTKEKRRKLTEKLHRFYDDGSCRRVTEALGI